MTRILALPANYQNLAICDIVDALCPPHIRKATAKGLACAEAVLNLGFYAYFEPVSYSAAADPDSAEFNLHHGYEADLLTALEAMDDAGHDLQSDRPSQNGKAFGCARPAPNLTSSAAASPSWTPAVRDRTGAEPITFTSGHIAFRPSLLVYTEDAHALKDSR